MRSGAWTRAVLPWILATCATAVVAAHHSTTEFDYTQQVTIKGTVKELQWSIEIGSPSLNINMGWRKSSVKAGDVVTMNIAPARSGKPYGTLRVLTFANGQKLEGVAARVGAGQRGAAPAPPAPAAPAARKEP